MSSCCNCFPSQQSGRIPLTCCIIHRSHHTNVSCHDCSKFTYLYKQVQLEQTLLSFWKLQSLQGHLYHFCKIQQPEHLQLGPLGEVKDLWKYFLYERDNLNHFMIKYMTCMKYTSLRLTFWT